MKNYIGAPKAQPILEWNRDDEPELQPVATKNKVYSPVKINDEILIVTDGKDRFVFYYIGLDPAETIALVREYIKIKEYPILKSSGKVARDEDDNPVIEEDANEIDKIELSGSRYLLEYPEELSNYLSEVYPEPDAVPVGYGAFESGSEFVKLDDKLITELNSIYNNLNLE